MEIDLNIRNHCIETETKRQYEKLIKHYFSRLCSDADKPVMEFQIEALKFFLEHADFPKLRSAHPELACGGDNLAVLKIPKNFYDIRIIMNKKSLPPRWTDKGTKK
jgi:hypothetical protein